MISSKLGIPPGPLLVVTAHPDDEILSATLIETTVAAGFPAYIACFTRGEAGLRGQSVTPNELGATRMLELRDACLALGAEPLMLTPFEDISFPDNNLHRVDPDAGVRALLPVFDRINPGLVVGFPDDGITGHFDHIWASQVALTAYHKAAPANAHFWQPVATPDWATLPLEKFMYAGRSLRIYPPGTLARYLAVQPRAKKIAAVQAHHSQSASLGLLKPAILNHEAYIEVS